MTQKRKKTAQKPVRKPQPQTTTVTLTAAVTMAGVAHDAGKTVTIAKDTADWLIKHNRAVLAEKE